MDSMNEIKLNFIDRVEKILSWKSWSIGSTQDEYDNNKLYTKLFTTISADKLYIPTSSIFNIFILLGAKANIDSEYIKTNFKFKDNKFPDAFRRIDDPEEFLDQALANMIEFINLSSYIYLQCNTSKLKSFMLKYLIVTASAMYDELYSSRGKNEFAYYFKKLLQNANDLEVNITPFNTETWRKEFSKFTKTTKQEIDEILVGTDDMYIVSISNITLIRGKMTDVNILPLREKYFIEAGIANYKTKEYNRIFITNFI